MFTTRAGVGFITLDNINATSSPAGAPQYFRYCLLFVRAAHLVAARPEVLMLSWRRFYTDRVR